MNKVLFVILSLSLISCGKHEWEELFEEILLGSSSSGEEDESSSSNVIPSSSSLRSSSSITQSSSSSLRSSSSSLSSSGSVAQSSGSSLSSSGSVARSSSSSLSSSGSVARSSSSSLRSSSSVVRSSSSSSEVTLDFTDAEQQRINAIRTRYSGIPASFSGGYFITTPTTTPTYTIGEVKPEVLQAGVDAVNLVRYIAGIPYDVELDAGYTELTQYGAVLLAAKDELTHTPSKPADMPQAFYDKGYEATTHSNISWATTNFPSKSVLTMYMDDSDPSNIDRLGHRRWILNPKMKKTGFGMAARYGVMYSFDQSRSTVDYDYVTWPSSGVFPTGSNFIYNDLAWSITVNTQRYGTPDINRVEVTLKHLNSGEVWTFSKNTQSSTANRSAYFNVERSGYGISNCIIFRPALDSSFEYKNGDVFIVTVSGLDRDLSYAVKMFSM